MTPPTKIVLVGPTYPFRGGISHYTTMLSQALSTRHQVRLLTFSRQYPAWLYPGRGDSDPSAGGSLRVAAEPVIDSLNPLTWWRAARLIQADQPELLLLQWTVPFWGPLLLVLAFLARRWSPRTRIALLCHNATPHEGGSPVARGMQRKVARWSDALLCHSQGDLATLRSMAPGVPAEAVMLPTYAPLAAQAPLPERGVARAVLGIDGEPLLLFFGFVRPYKGVDLLFEAMAHVLESLPAAFLVVAGEWWKDALPARARLTALGIGERVRLLDDYLPDERLPALFAAADVAVLPYRSATQSAVVQLAYGFDLPVITTAVGGLPEAVEQEVSGMVVPPDDPQALADAIIRYHREGWRDRLLPGVRAARDRFSWEALVAALERLALPPTP